MSRSTKTQLVTIRVPRGLPDEIRAVTSIPFSTLASNLLVSFLNHHRGRVAVAPAEPASAESASTPTETPTDV